MKIKLETTHKSGFHFSFLSDNQIVNYFKQYINYLIIFKRI